MVICWRSSARQAVLSLLDQLKLFFDRAAGDPVVRIQDGVVHEADGRTTQLQFSPLPIHLTPTRFALGMEQAGLWHRASTFIHCRREISVGRARWCC
jgi:hypothetical protein